MKKFISILYLALILIANPLGATGVNVLNIHETPRDGFSNQPKDIDGKALELGESDTALRIINVWALWCSTCRKEMAGLADFARETAGETMTFSTVASGRNDPDKVAEFMRDTNALNLPVYFDPKQKFASEAGVRAIPQTLFINASGEEIARIVGEADFNDEALRAEILKLANHR